MTQSQAPPKKEILSNDSREVNRSRVSSLIPNSPSANIQSSPAILPPNLVSTEPLSAVAPKRKRPRQASENTGSYNVRSSPISSTTTKFEVDQTPKADLSSPNLEKSPGSTSESGYDLSNLMSTSQLAAAAEISLQEVMKVESDLKAVGKELGESRDVVTKEKVVSSPKKESSVIKVEETSREDAATGSSLASVIKS